MTRQLTILDKLAQLISSAPHRVDLILIAHRIKQDQIQNHQNHHFHDPLITLSKASLNGLLIQKQLKLYKRSTRDINGYDFEWCDKYAGDKTTHLLSHHLKRFVTKNALQGISLPGNRMNQWELSTHKRVPPPRILAVRDNRAVLILLGWCQWHHCLDLDKVHSLIISNDTISTL